jgi:hypothetical protein
MQPISPNTSGDFKFTITSFFVPRVRKGLHNSFFKDEERVTLFPRVEEDVARWNLLDLTHFVQLAYYGPRKALK